MLSRTTLIYIGLVALGVAFCVYQMYSLGIIQFDLTGCDSTSGQFISNPSIEYFDVSPHAVTKGDTVTFSWKATNTDRVTISEVSQILPAEGTLKWNIDKEGKYYMKAYSGSCFKARYSLVEIISETTSPWLISILIIFAILLLDAIRLAVVTDATLDNFDTGNIWHSIQDFLVKVQNKKPWGVVYNATTKAPIARAIIRVTDTATNELVETTVSDVNGVFRINPKKGTYTIKVVRQGFTFPTRLINTDSDGSFTNVYHGGQLTVAADNQPLLISIPVDPEEIPRYSSEFRMLLLITESVLRWGSTLAFVFGSAISFVYLLQYRNILTLFTFMFFLGFISFKIYTALNKPKEFGIVRDTEGNIVPDLEIGVYEVDFHTLVARTFTNSKGQYNFIVPLQPYHLKVIDSSYTIVSNTVTEYGEPVILPKDQDHNFLNIVQDIVVARKIEVTPNFEETAEALPLGVITP